MLRSAYRRYATRSAWSRSLLRCDIAFVLCVLIYRIAVVWCGVVWCGLVWFGVDWYGLARRGAARAVRVRGCARGAMWRGVLCVRCVVTWSDALRRDVNLSCDL